MRIFLIAATLAFAAVSAPANAEDGVAPDAITIGMANALSGPAAGLETHVKAGAVTYLNKINASGGVNGRKIRLVSLDDGYEPERCIAATKKLLEEDKVFALFGFVGTQVDLKGGDLSYSTLEGYIDAVVLV